MSDPYRIPSEDRPSAAARQKRAGSPLRALLWVLLAAGAGVNVVANLALHGELNPVGLTAGIVGVAAGVCLIVSYVNGRRP
ncbi:hypothetical protein HII36_52225 [Nonomuraea sp. NN258]|uniref:hypothetical protein n=1 Tax=Nonomuraea antri TaxID=2730852 RepID=UPI00156918C7|nr:hypothetical protein [Nonomuraea antri]NRQ40336.1 hypothetical protein [Nonomuraea antri]